MLGPEQVFDWKFRSGFGWTLAQLSEHVAPLGERLGVAITHWEEEGLGPSRGFCLKLPSGRRLSLLERDHAVAHLGAPGATIEVDVGEAAEVGLERLLDEALSALGLNGKAVAWRPEDPAAWAAEARTALEMSRNR